MKGRMDILNLKKSFSPEVDFRGFESEPDEVIKLEPEDAEKEDNNYPSDSSETSSCCVSFAAMFSYEIMTASVSVSHVR